MKGDLSDFECGVGGGVIISRTADLLRFSHKDISRVSREWSENKKICSERQFFGWNWADRMATVTQ